MSISARYSMFRQAGFSTEMVNRLKKFTVQLQDAQGSLLVKIRSFTETSGNGTYTATFSLPEGAYILNTVFLDHVNWAASGGATMSFGTSEDPTMFLNAVDLKTTSPSEALLLANPFPVLLDEDTVFVFTVSKTGTGDTGRDTAVVIYSMSEVVQVPKT